MDYLPIILSVFPLIVFVALLLWKKVSLLKVSLITLLLFTLIGLFFWKIFPFIVVASYLKGIFVALDIFFIILGAVFFLNVLKKFNIIKSISYYLSALSGDYRVQVIILAWMFGAFMEGTAGFGTPAAIVAPLLIGIGFSPIRALILALLGNSAPGIFGAAGTPIRVGFAGIEHLSVPLFASIINCVGFIVPIFMLWVAVSQRENRKKEFTEALPFAIFAGFAFVIPSLLTVFLGQEFPSILGSIIGMILIFLAVRFKIFIPKNNLSLCNSVSQEKPLSIFKSFLPYGILIVFLIAGKILLGSLGVPISFGVGHTFNLFNPGFAFILSGLVTILIWKSRDKIWAFSIKDAFKKTIEPFIVIASMSAIVQIMINSIQNYSKLPSMIMLMAKSFQTVMLPFWAPFIGALGSFLTGSVTISNIMFGNFFNIASQALSFNVDVILSLGLVGAAAGNMIALADILSAEAVVGVKNKEREIIKGVFLPCFVYLLLVGIIGIIIFL